MLYVISVHFIYVVEPGSPECEGMYGESTEIVVAAPPPRNVATRHVGFDDMVEREVYTGASRSVRRNGSRELSE